MKLDDTPAVDAQEQPTVNEEQARGYRRARRKIRMGAFDAIPGDIPTLEDFDEWDY